MQHFMSNSPWSGQAVYECLQEDICATPQLRQGSFLILDENVGVKDGLEVDTCQVAVVLGYANWHSSP
jgi:hypothetical protein